MATKKQEKGKPVTTEYAELDVGEYLEELWDEKFRKYKTKTELIRRFIKATFIENVDFRQFKEGQAPSILKAGAEKIRRFMDWHVRLRVWTEKVGKEDKLIFRAEAIIFSLDANGNEVVEGMGTAAMYPKDKGAPDFRLNAACKICGKRAVVDGTIHAAGISDEYSQDKLRDEDEVNEIEEAEKEEAKTVTTKEARQDTFEEHIKTIPEKTKKEFDVLIELVNAAADMGALEHAGTKVKDWTDANKDKVLTQKLRSVYAAQARNIKQKENADG